MIEITRWDNGEIIHSGDFKDIRECLEDGVRKGFSFEFANMYRADLYRADLRGAYLIGASLDRANLDRANLYRADLRGAYLIGASLSRANLDRASLIEANLTDCIPQYTVIKTKEGYKVGCKTKTLEEWRCHYLSDDYNGSVAYKPHREMYLKQMEDM